MAYTATNWVEGVTTLGPTNMNKIETELVYLDTRIPPAALGYGTTLPGSPVDGQEYVLVDSTTNPTYQWRFRYNAGSTSTYKWESAGGTPAQVSDGTSQTVPSGSWGVWSTPVFTAPRAGEYLVTVTQQLFGSAAMQMYFGVSIGGATPSAMVGGAFVGANIEALWVLPNQIATLTSGQTLQTGSYAGATGGQSRQKALYIWPKRIS